MENNQLKFVAVIVRTVPELVMCDFGHFVSVLKTIYEQLDFQHDSQTAPNNSGVCSVFTLSLVLLHSFV